jgi:hypothetical protein
LGTVPGRLRTLSERFDIRLENAVRRLRASLVELGADAVDVKSVPLPTNLDRLVQQIRQRFGGTVVERLARRSIAHRYLTSAQSRHQLAPAATEGYALIRGLRIKLYQWGSVSTKEGPEHRGGERDDPAARSKDQALVDQVGHQG